MSRGLHSRRRQSGYTFIGLLIFLAILAFASATAIRLGSQFQQRADEAELLFVGAEFSRAIRSYYEATPAGRGQFPSALEDLLKDPRYPAVKRHLRKIYADPITGREQWGTVAAPGGGIMGVHSMSQKMPFKTTAPQFAQFSGAKTYSDWVFAFVPEKRALEPQPQIR